MSKVAVYSMDGASVGEIDIADGLLVFDKGNQAVHDVIVACMAGRRKGTASTLRKGEVAGSNKKPWRQKGTGRARAGYRQSPVWRGGGVAFGPHPRSYALRVNRKVARLAFRRAFSDKVAAGEIKVVDAIKIAEPKSKLFAALVKSLQIKGSALFVMDRVDRNVALAARNLAGIEVVGAKDLNVYQLLQYPTVVVSKPALPQIEARLQARAEVAAA